MKLKSESTVISQAVNEWFASYLPIAKGCSNHTQRSYFTALSQYMQFLQEEKKVTPNTLSAESYSENNLNDWLLWLKKTRKCSNSTCNDRLSGVKSFIKFLSIKDVRFNVVYLSSKTIKPMRKVKVVHEEITQKAIKSLFSVIRTDTRTGKRDLALFYLMYSIGARIDEILSVRICDLHLHEYPNPNYLTIIGKGYKCRTPPILKDVTKFLLRYIEVFHNYNFDSLDYLFYSFYDGKKKKMSQEAINKRLKMYATKANEIDKCVPCNLHCHTSLRHARATHWLEQGLNIVAIQRLMGHTDIRTTMRYIFVSVEQKNKALATLESASTLKLKKKWKELPKGQSLLEYVGLKK